MRYFAGGGGGGLTAAQLAQSEELKAASVAAVETETTVAPEGAWDFVQAPTVGGEPIGGGGGGATDHGALTGLADDDHPQYLNQARGDARYVPPARTITAGTGLSGGGDLSADRTLAVAYGSTAGTAAQGNDTRITGAAAASAVEGIKVHDGTAGGGIRPTGFARVRWVGGIDRPTSMAAGDVWEHDV